MKIQYDTDFIDALKKVDVRIRRSFEEAIKTFSKNPYDPSLNNHPLREPYQNYRSINITGDYRALYEEIHEGEEEIAYFAALGTHEELYGKSVKN